jgi:phosphoglycerate dehydrogenase-like enzyme
MPSIVAITEKEYRKAVQVFEGCEGLRCVPAPAEEERLVEAIRSAGARHAIVGVTPYRGPLYGALPAGGVLARFGVGHDGIDKVKATAAGLLVTNTPGALDQSVAEHTLLLMLAAVRHFEVAAMGARGGDWAAPAGSELAGKRLAVIGLGHIGRAVARIAGLGFGMRVRGCVRETGTAGGEGIESVTANFAEAVAEADFVSLHIAARPSTVGFLNPERLAQVPRRAWVINTARGSVVDETALYHALAAGRLAARLLVWLTHFLRNMPEAVRLPATFSTGRRQGALELPMSSRWRRP